MPQSKSTRYEIARREVRRAALERQSARCPVIKHANKVLDRDDILDLQHALDLLVIEMRYIPECAATVEVIKRLKSIGERVKP